MLIPKGLMDTSDFMVSRVDTPEQQPSSITFCHRPTGLHCTLRGALLEGQYRIGQKYLLLCSDGIPLEEILHLYLLDKRLQLLDEWELGAPYTAGIISNIGVKGARLTFTFFASDDDWLLEILATPRWQLTLPRYPVRRKGRWLRKVHMVLRRSA